MIYNSQLDPRWKNARLGPSNLTVGGYGCFICSLCTLAQVDASKLIFHKENHKFITKGGLLISPYAAKHVGMETKSSRSGQGLDEPMPDKDAPCIAITEHYKDKGIPTHFFVYLGDDMIIDPLDRKPIPKRNPYKIKRYRHFSGVKLSQRIIDMNIDLKDILKEAVEFNSKLWNVISEQREMIRNMRSIIEDQDEKMIHIQYELHEKNNKFRDIMTQI